MTGTTITPYLFFGGRCEEALEFYRKAAARGGGAIEELGSHGLPLALFPGKPYGSSKLTLAPADLLLLYTDGVTEANDPEGNEFGMPRLKEFLGVQLGKSAADVEKALGESLEEHAKGEPYADDRTLVMVRRLPA